MRALIALLVLIASGDAMAPAAPVLRCRRAQRWPRVTDTQETMTLYGRTAKRVIAPHARVPRRTRTANR